MPVETGPRPPRLNRRQAADYLQKVHGIPVTHNTLRNWAVAGRGPKCRYFGSKAIYDVAELDRWVTAEALSDVHPRKPKPK